MFTHNRPGKGNANRAHTQSDQQGGRTAGKVWSLRLPCLQMKIATGEVRSSTVLKWSVWEPLLEQEMMGWQRNPIVSCSGKIQNGPPFWCRLTQVVLEKRPLNGCTSRSTARVVHICHITVPTTNEKDTAVSTTEPHRTAVNCDMPACKCCQWSLTQTWRTGTPPPPCDNILRTIRQIASYTDKHRQSLNDLFFQDSLGKPAPETLNQSEF